jgi:hypothetical protein
VHSTTGAHSCFPQSGRIRLRVPFFGYIQSEAEGLGKQKRTIIINGLKNKLFLFFFCLDTKETKNQGRKDYTPFLPNNITDLLCYCSFSSSSLLLDSKQ